MRSSQTFILYFQVGGENKKIISEVQTPGGLWDAGRSSRQSVQESHNVKTHQASQRPQLMAQHGSEKDNGITPKEHILKTRDAIPQRDLSKSPKRYVSVYYHYISLFYRERL